MTYFKSILCLFTLLVSFHSVAISPKELKKLTLEQVYQKGKLLEQQKKDGADYLKYAADKGHAKAAWLYSHTTNSNTVIQTPEQSQYLTKAANLGHVGAMVMLSYRGNWALANTKEYWKQKSEGILLEKAKKNNVKAMYGLYQLYDITAPSESLAWIKKAAEAGFPPAQYTLAQEYYNGKGRFLIPGKRKKEIRRLCKASAEAGYPEGRNCYATILVDEGRVEEAFQWIQKNVNEGNAESLAFVADILIKKFDNAYTRVIPTNKLQGLAYYKAYLDSIGSKKNGIRESYLHSYRTHFVTLTKTEKQEVYRLTYDYLASRTVRYFNASWLLEELSHTK